VGISVHLTRSVTITKNLVPWPLHQHNADLIEGPRRDEAFRYQEPKATDQRFFGTGGTPSGGVTAARGHRHFEEWASSGSSVLSYVDFYLRNSEK